MILVKICFDCNGMEMQIKNLSHIRKNFWGGNPSQNKSQNKILILARLRSEMLTTCFPQRENVCIVFLTLLVKFCSFHLNSISN